MNGFADVDGFKICIQVRVWLGLPPLNSGGLGEAHCKNRQRERESEIVFKVFINCSGIIRSAIKTPT